MFWYLLLAWMSIAGADVEVASHHDEVQVQSAFFGARFNTKIKVTPTHLSKNGPMKMYWRTTRVN